MNSNRNKSTLTETNTRKMSGVPTAMRRVKRLPKKYSETIEDGEDDDGHIKVVVRCRPISEKEITDGHQSIIEFESKNRVIVHDMSATPSDQLGTKSGERKNYSHVFDFDKVFECSSTQEEIYDEVCAPIVDSVLRGYNGTIFAYGQTGTGKTYTMEGGTRQSASASNQQHKANSSIKRKFGAKEEVGSSMETKSSFDSSGGKIMIKNNNNSLTEKENFLVYDEKSAGVIPRAFDQIFNYVSKNVETQFLIRVSYLEVYQEELRDLLKRDKSIKLELHERPDIGVYVKDLTSFVCKSISEIERIMKVGNQNRMVGATDMNEHSSRSHAIFMITVEQQQTTAIETTSEILQTTSTTGGGGGNQVKEQKNVIRVGKLNLVDLAGSERQRKTNSFGQRQKESIKINSSLSALGNVINSLMKLHTQQEATAAGDELKQQNNKVSATTNKSEVDRAGRSSANSISSGSGNFIPYRDSKLTRLLQDSLGGNAKTLMIANIGPASYNYDETINTLNYASKAKCIRNKPRLNEDPKDALLRELQREIDDLRAKLKEAMRKNSNNLTKKGDEKNNPARLSTSEAVQVLDKNDDDDDNERIERELLELKQKLASLESKLLNGDKQNLAQPIDQLVLKGYTKEQELELERSRTELANQADRQRVIRDELERREEAELSALESFSSVQQEIETKRRLVMQILLKIKELRQEVDGKQETYRLELDELEQLQYVLQKELKLKCLIMDNFIPNSHVDQLLPRMLYDEKSNSCQVQPIHLPSEEFGCILQDKRVECPRFWLSNEQSFRPRSEFERMGETIDPDNIRFKYENIIKSKLEIPKLWSEYQRIIPVADPSQLELNSNSLKLSKTQALIDNALNEREADIVI